MNKHFSFPTAQLPSRTAAANNWAAWLSRAMFCMAFLYVGSAMAATVTCTGTTVGSLTWNRPVANGSNPPVAPLSGVGTAVPYNVVQITVDVSGSYSFQCGATSPAGWDNFTFLYQNSFDPTAPFTNVLIGNDDNPVVGLSGFSRNLTAGTNYYWVVTGFSNTDQGAWLGTISGPGVTTIVSGPPALPNTLVVTGTTVGGPTWNRPVANGGNPPVPPASGVGTAVHYNVIPITVDVSGSYAFQCFDGWDNYTFLYQNSFDPTAPFTNVLIGNDDNQSIGLSGFSRNLSAGTCYFFIVTGFSNTDAGAWSVAISGPGTATNVANCAPPTITPIPQAVFAGTSQTLSIATVNDAQDAENQLVVTITSANPANGVTLSNIAVDASGNVTALVTATCGGPTANFNLKVTDSDGLMATANETITFTDNTPPIITCPGNIVRSTDPGQCSAAVTYAIPTYSDNCPGAGLDHISGGTSGSTFQKGTTSVTWQATDAANLTRRCTFTITVTDNQAPTIACPLNLTRSTSPGTCSAAVTYANPTYSDNCPGAGIDHVSGGTSGSTFLKGATTVTWKATDAAGLTKTCTFRVTVNDTEAPTISCPASQSVNTAGNTCASAAVSYSMPTAMDNCPSPAPAVMRTGGLASGSLFPKGTNTVVWRAMDGTGNTKTCSFTVTVTDNVAPSITCPGNIAVTAAPGQCSTVATYSTPTATDNCAVASVVLTGGLASYSIFPQGVTTNTWRAMDDSGLTSTCAFTVTVSCGTGPSETTQAARETKKSVANLGLHLMPNPASTNVTISLGGFGASRVELTILDALGRVAWRQTLEAEQTQITVDLSALGTGAYWVSAKNDGQLITKRLIVQQ